MHEIIEFVALTLYLNENTNKTNAYTNLQIQGLLHIAKADWKYK